MWSMLASEHYILKSDFELKPIKGNYSTDNFMAISLELRKAINKINASSS